ncbi:hypothetical protein NDU88_002471, partial [Pleurodeles waltl]
VSSLVSCDACTCPSCSCSIFAFRNFSWQCRPPMLALCCCICFCNAAIFLFCRRFCCNIADSRPPKKE